MEIKSFISDALVQICEGIIDAQEKTGQMAKDGYFVPCVIRSETKGATFTEVTFDIALEVVNESGTGTKRVVDGNAKIFVASVEVSSTQGEKQTDRTSRLSRVQFKIPMIWPDFPNKIASQQPPMPVSERVQQRLENLRRRT